MRTIKEKRGLIVFIFFIMIIVFVTLFIPLMEGLFTFSDIIPIILILVAIVSFSAFLFYVLAKLNKDKRTLNKRGQDYFQKEIKCPFCKTMNKKGNDLCIKCGRQLKKICLYCSGENDFNNENCIYCGMKLS